MNLLNATVESIYRDDFFNFIYVRTDKAVLKLLKTEVPAWLEVGVPVECRIQEASIAICKGDHGTADVSIENRIEADVVDFRKGELLSELTLDSECGKVVSLISTEAFERMALEKGEHVTMLLKAVDIRLHPAL